MIRINSQSGKGGVAYILEQDHGLQLPRGLQVEFSKVVQAVTDRDGREMSGARIWDTFTAEYLNHAGPVVFVDHRTGRDRSKTRRIEGHGTGPIDAYVDALSTATGIIFTVADYREHAVGSGADAVACAYVEAHTKDGRSVFGVGMDKDSATAALRAVTSAVNRIAHSER